MRLWVEIWLLRSWVQRLVQFGRRPPLLMRLGLLLCGLLRFGLLRLGGVLSLGVHRPGALYNVLFKWIDKSICVTCVCVCQSTHTHTYVYICICLCVYNVHICIQGVPGRIIDPGPSPSFQILTTAPSVPFLQAHSRTSPAGVSATLATDDGSSSQPPSSSELQVRIEHDIDIFINIQYACMCIYAPDSQPPSPSELQVRIRHDIDIFTNIYHECMCIYARGCPPRRSYR